MAMRVGFGSASLWSSWHTDAPLEDEIQVNAMVALEEGQAAAAIAVADVCGMWPSTCFGLRDAIAEAVGTTPERVGIFCTQNHGAPMEGPGVYDLAQWDSAFVAAAREASASAQPAHVAHVSLRPDPPGVVNRRKRVPDLDSFSFYYGFELLLDGRAGCAELLEQAAHGLWSGPERAVRSPAPQARAGWPAPPAALGVPSNALLDDPVDSLVQALFFRSPAGDAIGSLSRWAAHPVTANARGGGHSGDYPAYIRRRLSDRFGGRALFLTGPCGNQAPLVHGKSRLLAEQTGCRVADLLLSGLHGVEWQDNPCVRAASRAVALPLRRDYPRDLAAAQEELESARRRFHQARREGGALRELKRLSEEIERLRYTVDGAHYAWCGFRVEELAPGAVGHPLYALRLGDAVIVGLPGEPFGSYSTKLRERCGAERLIVAEECNGYLSYIPPAEEYPLGGYGSAAAILDPAAEEVLLSEACDLTSSLL